MVTDELKAEYVGKCHKIIHCPGALESFEEITKGLNDRQKSKFARALNNQIQRLADEGRQAMTRENFPKEGQLPNEPGKPKRNFRAFKKIPIRGYCWKSELYQDTYFISHYRHKDYAKLAKEDTQRVCNNWNSIELQ